MSRNIDIGAIVEFVRKLLEHEPFNGEVYIAAHEIGEGAFCELKPLLKYFLKKELGIEITNEDILRGKEIHEELYSGVPTSMDKIIEDLIIFKYTDLVEHFLARKVNGVRLVGRVDMLTIKLSKNWNIILEIREGKSTSNYKYLQAKSQYELPFSWKIQALAYKRLLEHVDYYGRIYKRVIIEVIDKDSGEFLNEFKIQKIDKLSPYFEEILERLRNPEYIIANKYKVKAKHLCNVCSAKEYCNSIKEEKVITFWMEKRLKQ